MNHLRVRNDPFINWTKKLNKSRHCNKTWRTRLNNLLPPECRALLRAMIWAYINTDLLEQLIGPFFIFFIALLEPSPECGNSICWRTSLIKINDIVSTSSDNFARVSAEVDWFYYWETVSIANSVVEERHSKFKNPFLLIRVYHITLHWFALNSRDTFSSLWRELNAQFLLLLIDVCLMPSVPACKRTPLIA